MVGRGATSNLTLEAYDFFFHLPESDRHGFSYNKLNQILRMHTRIVLKSKIATVESLSKAEIMHPTRSTLIPSRSAAYPCAAISVDEIRADIAALGWQECPIGSLATVTPKAATPPAEDPLRLLSDTAASHSNAASSAVGKRKKLKRRMAASADLSDAAAESNPSRKGRKLKRRTATAAVAALCC